MKLCRIKDDYIDFLINYTNEKNIRFNKNEKRIYIGVVFNIDNKKYFAPLSHPQEKYKKMKESIDLIKIKNSELGVINLNNMIPIISNKCIINFDIEDTKDKKYKNLLKNQFYFISKNKKKIQKNASILYSIVANNNIKQERIIKRCNNFKLLEKASEKYQEKINYIPLDYNLTLSNKYNDLDLER